MSYFISSHSVLFCWNEIPIDSDKKGNQIKKNIAAIIKCVRPLCCVLQCIGNLTVPGVFSVNLGLLSLIANRTGDGHGYHRKYQSHLQKG